MQIFENEIKDGLKDVLTSNNSIAYLTEAKIAVIDQSQKDTYKSLLTNVTDKQIDLMYLEDILATTGWNANDDVFDPEETNKAKDTPVDKQFNYMHYQDQIIGHITASKIIDLEGNEIDASGKIPEHFHVVSGSVIYTKFRDKDQQEARDNLVQEIQDGKWCVSMECLFPNFDYALLTASGEQRIIKRNEKTSYLTKYLRAYGGTGYVDGNKIGRLLRDFTFSGKGLVTKPANKQSVILNSIANVKFNATETIDNMEIVDMTIDQKMYDDIKAEAAALKLEVSTLKSKTEESVANSFKAEIDALKAKIASLTEGNTSLANEVTNYKGLSEEKTSKISELETKVKEANDALAAVKTELETTKADIVNTQRLAKLIGAGVEETKAQATIKTFATASDSMFDEVYSLLKKPEEAPVNNGQLQNRPEETDTGVVADVENAQASTTAPLNTTQKLQPSQLGEKITNWVGRKSKVSK